MGYSCFTNRRNYSGILVLIILATLLISCEKMLESKEKIMHYSVFASFTNKKIEVKIFKVIDAYEPVFQVNPYTSFDKEVSVNIIAPDNTTIPLKLTTNKTDFEEYAFVNETGFEYYPGKEYKLIIKKDNKIVVTGSVISFSEIKNVTLPDSVSIKLESLLDKKFFFTHDSAVGVDGAWYLQRKINGQSYLSVLSLFVKETPPNEFELLYKGEKPDSVKITLSTRNSNFENYRSRKNSSVNIQGAFGYFISSYVVEKKYKIK